MVSINLISLFILGFIGVIASIVSLIIGLIVCGLIWCIYNKLNRFVTEWIKRTGYINNEEIEL